MLERIILVAIVLLASYSLYRLYSRWHLRRASAAAQVDPLLNSLRPGATAVVYFTTPSCVPCRTQQKPTLTKLQDELGEKLQVIQIDAVDQPETAERWGVLSVPTTFVIGSDGRPVAVNHGTADIITLRRQIDSVRAS